MPRDRIAADACRNDDNGRAGRERSLQTYQWKHVVSTTQDVYDSVLTPSVETEVIR